MNLSDISRWLDYDASAARSGKCKVLAEMISASHQGSIGDLDGLRRQLTNFSKVIQSTSQNVFRFLSLFIKTVLVH
jgi:hypothetical protein